MTDAPSDSTPPPPPRPESAGCFPAILAATLLLGMVMFLTFGFAGYVIFQKRGDLAVRTLRGTILPEVEQSRLDPETKQAVMQRLTALTDDIEQKKLENWQAGGAMNRLVRSPLLRWGDLVAVDAWAAKNLPAADYPEFHKQVTRFLRAAELDRAISSDIHDVLVTVTQGDPGMMLGRLKPKLVESDVREVGIRAKLVADRAEIPDQVFDNVSLPKIVDRLIELGIREGST
ncbi:MAG: hypothetical protein ACO1RT_11315 [Planctomycetaceae bacterium]